MCRRVNYSTKEMVVVNERDRPATKQGLEQRRVAVRHDITSVRTEISLVSRHLTSQVAPRKYALGELYEHLCLYVSQLRAKLDKLVAEYTTLADWLERFEPIEEAV